MEYVMVIHTAEEGGYWIEVPTLPGCFTQAETLDEVLSAAPEAIASHLKALRADGPDVPNEPVMVATVRAPEPARP